MTPLHSLDTVAQRMSDVERRVSDHSDDHDNMWAAIESLRNRLPLWATILIGFLASICGGSLTILGDLFIRGMM